MTEEKAEYASQVASMEHSHGQALAQVKEQLNQAKEEVQVQKGIIKKMQQQQQSSAGGAGSSHAYAARGSSPNPGSTSSAASSARDRVMDYLPADVRHKRQVSLTALRARMNANATAMADGGNQSKKQNGTLAEAEDGGSTSQSGEGKEGKKGKKGVGANGLDSVQEQFGDEIMFCCPACEGDLINL